MCKSDHREATFGLYSVTVPRALVMMSPTTPAVINVSSVHHEYMPEVVVEASAPLAAVRSISEEIWGDLGAVGEHPVGPLQSHTYHCIILTLISLLSVPLPPPHHLCPHCCLKIAPACATNMCAD